MRRATARSTGQKTLVVHYHPRTDSLGQSATERVLSGLKSAGCPVKVLDLSNNFEPALSLPEWQGHITDDLGDRLDFDPRLSDHIEALRWASRLILVYPTWFGGQPAPVKGWFDRVWVQGVAWELPEGKNLLRGLLKNIRSIEIVTTHGSSRLVNAIQGNPGRVTVFRGLRVMCHPLCRTHWHALYKLDRQTPENISDWLTALENRYSGSPSAT